MKTCSVVLTFESVVEILWCDHSNETFSAVLLHGTICFTIFYKIKFRIFLEFLFLALWKLKAGLRPEVERLEYVPALCPSAQTIFYSALALSFLGV